MSRRRRRRLVRTVPWVIAALLIGSVALLLREASSVTADELVAHAEEIRRGDPLNDRPRDPRGSLTILRAVLDRSPEHYGALVGSAMAYADLTNYDLAVTQLERAAEVAENDMQAIRARRLAINQLTAAGRYDDAVAKAAEIVELQPNNVAHQLQLGLAQYNGSTATQAALTRRWVGAEKDDAELEIEARIEAFVTDLWGEPDPDELVQWLAPEVDPDVRAEIRAELVDARRRFLDASRTLAAYRDYDDFDQRLAEAWAEILLRSGRLFDAHLEAAITLRHPRVPGAATRHFLEILATCESAVGEHARAAERYEEITRDFLTNREFAPPRYLDLMLEERVAAEQWELLLERLPTWRKWSRDTEMLDWAEAEARAALGDREGARDAIRAPANIVSLGTLLPISLRGFPERRRAILLLANELYSEVGDSRGLRALDALLNNRPDDHEARRRRIDALLQAGLLDAAQDDAFALFTRDRRDPEDFALWLDIGNRISQAHYGRDLGERARSFVQGDLATRNAFLDAQFVRSQLDRASSADLDAPATLTGAGQRAPDLAYEIVQARLEEGDLAQARIETRQLAEQYPQVQMFRFLLARLLVREGKYEAASHEFRALLDDLPGDSETLELAMRVELAVGRAEQAATLVNEMILADPRGVGAVRYGLRLLERGQPERVTRLVERLFSERGDRPGLDVWLLAARAHLAQGELEQATNILAPLATTHPDSDEVALLGLELGLARGVSGLVDAAAERLQLLARGLFPNQLERLTALLLEHERPELLLQIFADVEPEQPSLRSALRPLASAAKAMGEVEQASHLLALADDRASLRDRFLLLSLDGRGDEAARRLRLEAHELSRRPELELCEMVGQALRGQRALVDTVPAARLREMGFAEELGPRRLELLDALLRLLPVIDNLDDVLPRGVLRAPLEAYPVAGPEVADWIDLARRDTPAAREAARALLLMLLAGDRPFWERESRFLARRSLELLPSLVTASTTLARRSIDAGEPLRALAVLEPLLARHPADVEFLELALGAARDLGREAWGLALVARQQERPEVRLLLARTLTERGLLDDARVLYDSLLKEFPDDRQVLDGALQLAARQRRQSDAAFLVRRVLERHPLDTELLETCLDTLASFVQPEGDARALAEELAAVHPEHLELQAAVARAAQDDPARVEAILDGLLAQVEAEPLSPQDPRAAERALVLRQAASTANRTGLAEHTRRLYELSLLLEPGAVEHYRELAYLELEQGRLLAARRYLEVLAFVEPSDKQAVLSLARLLFEQVGQPHVAAELVREAYYSNMPPEAVEVLAADAYLRGQGETALALFQRVANSPLLTEETYLTVGRIAYAAGLDEAATKVFELFLARSPADHPTRGRVEALLKLSDPDAGKGKGGGGGNKGGKGKAGGKGRAATAAG